MGCTSNRNACHNYTCWQLASSRQKISNTMPAQQQWGFFPVLGSFLQLYYTIVVGIKMHTQNSEPCSKKKSPVHVFLEPRSEVSPKSPRGPYTLWAGQSCGWIDLLSSFVLCLAPNATHVHVRLFRHVSYVSSIGVLAVDRPTGYN